MNLMKILIPIAGSEGNIMANVPPLDRPIRKRNIEVKTRAQVLKIIPTAQNFS